jgi:predicted dehydrogenase
MPKVLPRVLIVGAGFVADFYLASLRLHPEVEVAGVFDRDPERTRQFCAYWSLPAADSLDALLARGAPGDLVLNLTNPASHYEISRTCLEAGFHVYSEKPLAMQMDQASALVDLAADRGLRIASAPCSFLGEAAQTLWAAVREKVAGEIRLVYAEMDDDFVPQAPYHKWLSESGTPWPAKDEFEVGCTLEHAGYWLAWLLPIFGPVRTVVAASAGLIPKDDVTDRAAPDLSIGTLFFESGVVARLTCSIIAEHDHDLRLIGDAGVIELTEAWNNATAVKYRRRFTLRRKIVTSPLPRTLRLPGPTHPMKSKRRKGGMNFALGPVEMLEAIVENRPCRLSPELSLHVNEITLALQNAGETGGAVTMQSRFDPVEPMPWARALKS